jgi:glycosyltransferase involved in cell wall biosynthesis
MILIVAPYNGNLPETTPFLAGAKKIRAIIKIIELFDDNIVLLNSGYGENTSDDLTVSLKDFDGQAVIKVLTPPTGKNSRFKLFLNLLNYKKIIEDIILIHGVPNVVWCYNGYAFEMRVAAFLSKKYHAKTILEFEDWHFARSRLFSPKPYLDWIFWRLALSRLDFGVAVNGNLANKLNCFNIKSMLLPGVVSPFVSTLSIKCPPFKSKNTIVGYFGGLSGEKGAGEILKLVKDSSVNANFIVTGNGELQGEFESLAKIMPSRLKFLGPVSEEDLISAIAQSDVIINPHVVNDGIFPFKIIEALASGRLLISTKLPMHGYEGCINAIQFYDGSYSDLAFMINNAADIYRSKKIAIDLASNIVNENYSDEKLTKTIGNVLKAFGVSNCKH